MKILVIGAGAIGSLVGGKLAGAGHQVTLAGRPELAQIVNEFGLVLIEEPDRRHITSLTAAGSIASAVSGDGESFDLAILAVKSYDTAAALEELGTALDCAGQSTPNILSMQNGVGNEESIADRFGADNVIAGAITTPVIVPEAGVIQVEKSDYAVGISKWTPAFSDSTVEDIHQALADAGFDVTAYPQATGLKWTKLLMNMVGNATSAILDMPPQDVFADPLMVDMEINAWREALAVMRKSDISPVNLGRYPFRVLAPLIRTMPCRLLRPVLQTKVGSARGGKMPSLHIDLYRGRLKSEVTWLNGAVVRQGERVGVPTPVNHMLTDTLLQLVDDAGYRDRWRHSPARLAANAAEYTDRVHQPART